MSSKPTYGEVLLVRSFRLTKDSLAKLDALASTLPGYVRGRRSVTLRELIEEAYRKKVGSNTA